MKRSRTAFALLLFAGCHAAAPSSPEALDDPPEPSATATATATVPRFDHALVRSAPVDLLVTADGAPLPRVRVTLRTHAGEGEFAPGVLYQGLTDAAGRVRARLSLRSDQALVDLTLQRPGYRGPYDDETLRAQHGAFAPSSWRTVSAAALAAMAVTFTAVPR